MADFKLSNYILKNPLNVAHNLFDVNADVILDENLEFKSSGNIAIKPHDDAEAMWQPLEPEYLHNIINASLLLEINFINKKLKATMEE